MQRLMLPGVSRAERLLFRMLGVADPAHYLHSRYFRRALDRSAMRAPTAILDAGCGRGDYSIYLAQRFPQATIVGVDVDRGRVERNQAMARTLGLTNLRFEVADLVTATFPERFDLIVSIDVLEHIDRQEDALRNLASLLAPGGWVFFHLPTRRLHPVPFHRALAGFQEWAAEEHVAEERTAEEFVEVMRRAGFEVVRWMPTFGWYTGELATSLFNMPYEQSMRNRIFQALLAPVCRLLALADSLGIDRTRYAVAVEARGARTR